MAIRPENRKYYDAHWRAYRLKLIEVHGPLCSNCGVWVEEYLNLAHITHDPRSSAVRLLCAACHARHDSAQRYAMTRRSRARRVGQLWLLPEVEWSPYPTWQIPASALNAGQVSLFR